MSIVPHDWTRTAVHRTLTNPIYLGKLVNLRSTTKSIKSKDRIHFPEEDWIVTENTHEALVSEQDFKTVQERINSRQRSRVYNLDNIFRSLLFCNDCGKRMVFQSQKLRNPIQKFYYFRCNNNVRHGKDMCSAHYINFEQLKAVVLHDIQKHASLIAEKADKYVEHLQNLSESKQNGNKVSYQKEAEKCKKRLGDIDRLIQKLYEDRVFEFISDERYIALSENLEDEQKSLKVRQSELTDYLKGCYNRSKDVTAFAELIKQYTEIIDLDSELVHTLVEKIIVHEKEVLDGETMMRIDIYYRFIGNPNERENLTVLPANSVTKDKVAI